HSGELCDDLPEHMPDVSSTATLLNTLESDITTTTSILISSSVTTEDDTKLNFPLKDQDITDDNPSEKKGPLHTGVVVGIVLAVIAIAVIILGIIYVSSHPLSPAALFFIERRSHRWPAMKFRNNAGHPTYTEVEPMGNDKEGFLEAEQC
ncbi:hypothetical protein scyTo_0002878, partial [Scyliorhinus torazame]|nr:hypothetical protein [Scyliorhinus torazame]